MTYTTTDAFSEKYRDLAEVMSKILRWRNLWNDFQWPYNREMEKPVTLEEVELAEKEMLQEIRRRCAIAAGEKE